MSGIGNLPVDVARRYRAPGLASARNATHPSVFRHADSRVDRLAAFLRRREDGQDVAAKVAARSGIPFRTIERWLSSAPSEPRLSHFVALVAAYGPGVIAACFDAAPRWLDESVQRQRAEEIEARIANLKHELSHIRGGRDADNPARHSGNPETGGDRVLPMAR